ncbi:MAG: HU family DNA-binding protein [Prevotellaceae bacterium]|nr:HU family DNA-binding protein [Prevotellaceae bacterium]
MNNKEFVTELARRLGTTQKETTQWASVLVECMTEEWTKVEVTADDTGEEKSVAVHGFGAFEVRKKGERVSVRPSTGDRMLVPPKLVLAFRPSRLLKERFNIVVNGEGGGQDERSGAD